MRCQRRIDHVQPDEPAPVVAGDPLDEGGERREAVLPGRLASIPDPAGQRLEPFDPKSDVPDSFAPPPLASKSDPAALSSDNGAADALDRVGRNEAGHAAFAARHTVEGVMIDQRLKIAVIDGELRQLGQTIDGCTLVNITDYEVRFECRDGIAALKVHGEELLPED